MPNMNFMLRREKKNSKDRNNREQTCKLRKVRYGKRM